MFWIQLNYISKSQSERQELVAPAEPRPQAEGKLRSLMSLREEQGRGLIIAHVAEEFKGGDYGEK